MKKISEYLSCLPSLSQLQFTVEISYFEIYNEKIHDLLAPSKKKDGKKVQVNHYFLLLYQNISVVMYPVLSISTDGRRKVLAIICSEKSATFFLKLK